MCPEVGVDKAYSKLQLKVPGFDWCETEPKIGVEVVPEIVALVTCVLSILNLHAADYIVVDPCVEIGFDLIEVSVHCNNQLVYSNQQFVIFNILATSLGEFCVQSYGPTCGQPGINHCEGMLLGHFGNNQLIHLKQQMDASRGW